jgi:C2 domain
MMRLSREYWTAMGSVSWVRDMSSQERLTEYSEWLMSAANDTHLVKANSLLSVTKEASLDSGKGAVVLSPRGAEVEMQARNMEKQLQALTEVVTTETYASFDQASSTALDLLACLLFAQIPFELPEANKGFLDTNLYATWTAYIMQQQPQPPVPQPQQTPNKGGLVAAAAAAAALTAAPVRAPIATILGYLQMALPGQMEDLGLLPSRTRLYVEMCLDKVIACLLAILKEARRLDCSWAPDSPEVQQFQTDVEATEMAFTAIIDAVGGLREVKADILGRMTVLNAVVDVLVAPALDHSLTKPTGAFSVLLIRARELPEAAVALSSVLKAAIEVRMDSEDHQAAIRAHEEKMAQGKRHSGGTRMSKIMPHIFGGGNRDKEKEKEIEKEKEKEREREVSGGTSAHPAHRLSDTGTQGRNSRGFDEADIIESDIIASFLATMKSWQTIAVESSQFANKQVLHYNQPEERVFSSSGRATDMRSLLILPASAKPEPIEAKKKTSKPAGSASGEPASAASAGGTAEKKDKRGSVGGPGGTPGGGIPVATKTLVVSGLYCLNLFCIHITSKPSSFLTVTFKDTTFTTPIKASSEAPKWSDLPAIVFPLDDRGLDVFASDLSIKLFYQGRMYGDHCIGEVKVKLSSVTSSPLVDEHAEVQLNLEDAKVAKAVEKGVLAPPTIAFNVAVKRE